MIEITTRTLAGGEILHATPAGKQQQALPTIVFYHGFTSSKTVYSYFAVALAQAGFRVIMPDAPEHGARFNGDAAGRFRRFWQILHGNLVEYPNLRDALLEEGLVAQGQLAVGGASMGGMTALGIMTRHPEVRCVAALMGSGYFSSLARTLFQSQAVKTAEQEAELARVVAPLAPYEVGHQLDKLADRPLFLWHGEEDDVVPAAESFRLQQALAEAGLDARLTFRWEAGVKHRITPQALDATADFFRAHL